MDWMLIAIVSTAAALLAWGLWWHERRRRRQLLRVASTAMRESRLARDELATFKTDTSGRTPAPKRPAAPPLVSSGPR